MPRLLSAFGALPFALALMLSASTPVAAVESVKQTGSVGNWSFAESSSTPRTTCSYGPEAPPDDSFTTQIKVKPPTVFAADRTSGKVNKRKVSWQVQLQHEPSGGGSWVNGTTSSVQRATAYDNKQAPFTALTIKHDGHKDPNDALRIKVTIKWYAPNGSVEGKIVFNPTYYREVTPFGTATGGEPWCEADQTAG